jgi:hypothetical protein
VFADTIVINHKICDACHKRKITLRIPFESYNLAFSKASMEIYFLLAAALAPARATLGVGDGLVLLALLPLAMFLVALPSSTVRTLKRRDENNIINTSHQIDKTALDVAQP